MHSSARKKPRLELFAAAGDDEEEAAAALVERHAREVEHCKIRFVHYETQLDLAEKKLVEAQAGLARLRSLAANRNSISVPVENNAPQPTLDVHAARQKNRREEVLPSTEQETAALSPSSAPSITLKGEGTSAKKLMNRRKEVCEKHQQDLTQSIRCNTVVNLLNFERSALVMSEHRRRLRCLELCPTNDYLFLTSALDGTVNLWEVQPKGPSISLVDSADCLTPNKGRPEDMAWHPDGKQIFSAYSADGGQSQVSILDLNAAGQGTVTFLEEKPHIWGGIASINFMPWDDICFATCGRDHAVVLWKERDYAWRCNKLHTNLHTSGVTGVFGFHSRKTVLTVGEDRRIIAYDTLRGQYEFKHQIDSRCLGVLTNPVDFNLFMVHTGSSGKQLRLYDLRSQLNEVHHFGWQQESSHTQSGLVTQSWSPDGWRLSSGSMDPLIHIFDIRYDGRDPIQSIRAHKRRVFKAVWHRSAPLLTSISSDLNIGLHKIY